MIPGISHYNNSKLIINVKVKKKFQVVFIHYLLINQKIQGEWKKKKK